MMVIVSKSPILKSKRGKPKLRKRNSFFRYKKTMILIVVLAFTNLKAMNMRKVIRKKAHTSESDPSKHKTCLISQNKASKI